MDEEEAWVQLYIKGEGGSGGPFPIEFQRLPKKRRICDLAEAVYDKMVKVLPHCGAPHLVVYKAGTEFPPKEEEKLRPSMPVPQGTTDEKPLRVVAPAIVKNQQDEQDIPPFTGCIYILCSKEGNTLAPIGTAFAVADDLALTAAHNVANGKTNKPFKGQLVLTTYLERKEEIVGPGKAELINVRVLKFDLKADWAVLKRLDNTKFHEKIPVATSEDDIPPFASPERLDFYHCSVAIFLGGFPALHASAKVGRVGMIGGGCILFQNGGFNGSSGGAYVYRGKAIAIHTESINSALTKEALLAHQKTYRNRLPDNDALEIDDAVELAESCASSHASNGSGILIHLHAELIQCIYGPDK